VRTPSACQALDMNGRRCRETSRLVAVNYHGNDELYGFSEYEPKWVRVYLCPKHRTPRRAGKGTR